MKVIDLLSAKINDDSSGRTLMHIVVSKSNGKFRLLAVVRLLVVYGGLVLARKCNNALPCGMPPLKGLTLTNKMLT